MNSISKENKIKSDAKILYNELDYCFNMLQLSKTFLEFHGKESIQLKKCIETIENSEKRINDVLCKFEDKYWG